MNTFEPIAGPQRWTDYLGSPAYGDFTATPGGTTTIAETTRYLVAGGPAAQQTVSSGATKYLHGDLIESTGLTTDSGGGSSGVLSVAYSAFGELIAPQAGGSPANLGTRYLYAGQFGYESGLVAAPATTSTGGSAAAAYSGANALFPALTLQHLGARWYQPDIGRFVQRDPIGSAGGVNCYAYCDSHPQSCVDPFGLEWETNGPTWARWFLNGTGGRRSFLDNRPAIDTASRKLAGFGTGLIITCVAPLAVANYIGLSAAGYGAVRYAGASTGNPVLDEILDGVAVGAGLGTGTRAVSPAPWDKPKSPGGEIVGGGRPRIKPFPPHWSRR